MASISNAVESLKSSFEEHLSPDSILAICDEVRHRWRCRCLDPVTTIWLFGLQILHRNTACSHVARLRPGGQVSDSAYCQARSRLPLRLFQRLFELVARSLQADTNRPVTWHGHRVLIVDGSSCSMPDTRDLDKAFGHQPSQLPGCSFPLMSVLAVFELGSGLLVDLVMDRWERQDARLLSLALRRFRRGDVLLADRGLSGWCQLAMLLQRGVHTVARIHPSRSTKRGRAIGVADRLARWDKPSWKPDWMDQAAFDRLPDELFVRVLEYRVEVAGYRTQRIGLVTTLLDPQAYSKAELTQLYFQRWDIEIYFRHLKQTLNMDILKCRTADGVRKEVYMFGIIYNLVRVTMLEAADRQGVPPDRISFVDVLRWLTDRKPAQSMPVFQVNRPRPGRDRPRVVKRRPKAYPRLQPHHFASIRQRVGT